MCDGYRDGMTVPDSTAAVPQPTLRSAEADECQILLIRHGRSADVVPGSPESADPSLHPLGVEQATRLAARLSGMPLAAVHSSHLARALQTARPLAAERGLEVVVDPDLEEIRLGDWANGEFRRRAAVRDPEWVAWSRTGRWDGIPGCEGDDVFRTRLDRVIAPIAARHAGQSVAVVCHGGAIAAYLAHVLGTPRSLWLTVENTSVTVVRIGSAGPTVVTANDCHHLYDPVTGR